MTSVEQDNTALSLNYGKTNKCVWTEETFHDVTTVHSRIYAGQHIYWEF
jgi:hypothetical protein